MRNLLFLVRRNIALFLTNKLNIVLSFMSIVIFVSLYVFFLRNFLIDLITATPMDTSYVKEFTDRMMFAGLLIVINTTTSFGIIQICVNDSATGIKRDYLSAPITSFTLLIGYWLSSIIVSFTFTIMAIAGGEIYFLYTYGTLLTTTNLIKISLTIVTASCINSGILLCFANELNNTATFSTFANLYGTVIGFLAGTYLPYYFFPKWLKPILFYYPPTQLTSIVRQEYLSNLELKLTKISPPQLLDTIYKNFGIQLQINNKSISTYHQWSILIFSIVVLLIFLKLRDLKSS